MAQNVGMGQKLKDPFDTRVEGAIAAIVISQNRYSEDPVWQRGSWDEFSPVVV